MPRYAPAKPTSSRRLCWADVYQPPAFVADADAAAALIDEFALAQLIVATPDGLLATAVPLIRRGASLVGHLARPNRIWQHEGPALAIFTGPQAYVSPNWYPRKHVDGKVVPTWNYETVQVQGRLIAHDDATWKHELVSQLTDTFEAGQPRPWQTTDAPSDYIATMLRGIVGIELADLRIEGKRKLSQNRPDADRGGVIAALSDGGATQRAVAARMTVPDPGA